MITLKKKNKYILKLANGEEEYFKSLQDLCDTIKCSMNFCEKYISRNMYIDFDEILSNCKGKGKYQTERVISRMDSKYNKAILIKL